MDNYTSVKDNNSVFSPSYSGNLEAHSQGECRFMEQERTLFQAILGPFGPNFGPYKNLPNIWLYVNLRPF